GIQALGGFGAGLLVAVLLVSWRLSSGPVSVGFLNPYIQRALGEAHQGALTVDFDDTILAWAGWERTLDIRIVNLRTMTAAGEVLASAPKVSVSLSAQALLHGVVAPRSIEFIAPSFSIVRQPDGSYPWSQAGFAGADGGAGTERLLTALVLLMLNEPNPGQAMSYLNRVHVSDASVRFEDRASGTVMQSPVANAKFLRIDDGLEAEVEMSLLTEGASATLAVTGAYSRASARFDAGVSFEDLSPAVFATLSPELAPLGGLELPVSGRANMSVAQNGRIEQAAFDIRGGEGALGLPVPLAERMGVLGWAQRVAITRFVLSGQYDGSRVDVRDLVIDLVPGQTVHIPDPIGHDLPLTSIHAAGSHDFGANRLDVTRLALDVGGPEAEISAVVSNVSSSAGEPVDVELSGSVVNVPFDGLERWWPAPLAVDARTWVLANMSKGIGEKADIKARLAIDGEGGVALHALDGSLTARGVTVDYVSPMPPATDAVATATFNDNRFDIQLIEGQGFEGLRVVGGTIAMTELDTDDPLADIVLDVEGDARAALRLIDFEPLGFATDLGISPDSVGGKAAGRVHLKFPFLKDLKASDVTAEASARISGASIKGVLFKRDLKRGDLALDVDNDGLELKGAAVLGKIPVQLTWNHDFRTGALFSDRYALSGRIKDVLNLDALGVRVPEVLKRYIRGGAQVNVDYTIMSDGRRALSTRMDLADIVLSIPELGWSKPTDVPGTATLELRLDGDSPTEIPSFTVSAPSMEVAGSAHFGANGRVSRIDLKTMQSGHTDVSGSLTPLPDGAWELVLRGESLDAGALWDELIGVDEDDTPDEDKKDEELRLNVAVDLRQLRIREGRVMEDLIGTLYRDKGLWRAIDMHGRVGDDGEIEFLLDSDADGLRYVSITSDDAGSALRTLDLHDNILRGQFDLKAAYTGPGPDAPLQGVAKVRDYAMIESPAFAKLIGILSLTAVLDALQGEGLNFDVLEAPFILDDGVLKLVQARTSGPTLGVTANGTVDMDNKVMDVEGTVVPAYAINALLGKLPIIGELFTGPEKGGGLFAASYVMKGQGDNVEVTVNPLTVLAPGVLRGIFTGTGKEQEVLEGIEGGARRAAPEGSSPQGTPTKP
ncbi:MAG: hypothetical protein HQL36_05340, partial [Alphaproteobacteria bacterium]|nr:hypothetical protein [Alphaproteobacteria bacterium]